MMDILINTYDTMAKILLVEDEINIASFIERGLREFGHEVYVAYDGAAGWELTQKNDFQLLILDIIMPKMNGLQLCKQYRQRFGYHAPVIMLTALGTTEDIVSGLDAGADDYLTKPFRPTVLLMRVKALLRRVEMERGGDPLGRDITVGDLRFSGDEKRLFCREKPLALSPNELKMLLFLMRGEGKAFSRDELLTHIWGYNDEVETRVTDETLRRIRSKLSSADSRVQIETVWGYGYRLRSDGGTK